MDNEQMQPILDVKEVIRILGCTIELSGWYEIMKPLLNSSNMERAVELLMEDSSRGYNFAPDMEYVFRFMQKCHTNTVKCVILAETSSDMGIPLSTEYGQQEDRKCVESLYAELEGIHGKAERTSLLWAVRGVLMIPISPTHRDNSDSHIQIWAWWIARLIDKVSELYPDIPWLLYRSGSEYRQFIASDNIMEVDSTTLSYSALQWVNECITASGKEAIQW